jgi:hypothetical protein
MVGSAEDQGSNSNQGCLKRAVRIAGNLILTVMFDKDEQVAEVAVDNYPAAKVVRKQLIDR